MRKYLMMNQNQKIANLYIYGDITSNTYDEEAINSKDISQQIAEIEAEEINVYINSYGGEVAEGFAIYNALKRHSAKVRTICDGFACSIASVIFMAGDERIMNKQSLLMIHNAWTVASGNSSELREQADTLDKMGEVIASVYVNDRLDQLTLNEMLSKDTWLDCDEAIHYGLATTISDNELGYQNNVRNTVYNCVRLDVMVDKVLNKLEGLLERIENKEIPETEEIVEETKEVTALDLIEEIFNL